MVRCPRRAPGSRSHRRIAELCERAAFRPERLESRQLMSTVAWDGDAGDGDFTNPINWEGDIMPTSGDDAVIDVNGGPFIELRAGDFASLKSLTVDWPLSINGTLGVSDQMTVGAVFFDIGPDGRLESNNITLQASTGGISNQGEWTIGGTSLIDRRIESTGNLLIAQSAAITLGIGLNAALQYGSIDVTGGAMTIRQDATLTGADPAVDQLRIATVLTLDGAATFSNLGLNADGASTTNQVHVNFDPSLESHIIDSQIRFEFAIITGVVNIADTEVSVSGRAIFSGQTTAHGGSLLIDGSMLVRPPVATPAQPNGFAIEGATVTTGVGTTGGIDRLHGAIIVTGSSIELLSNTSLGKGLALHDVSIHAASNFPAKTWWYIDGLLTASGLTTSGQIMWVNPVATLTLEGSGLNVIGTKMQVLSGGVIHWTDGDLQFTLPPLTSNLRASVNEGGLFRAEFTGPGSHALEFVENGLLQVDGGFTVTFDDPSGELVVNGTFTNHGRVEVTGGLLRFESGLLNTEAGRFVGIHGQWVVGAGATLELDETVTVNAQDLTVIDDGKIPALADITLNTGTITLQGEGGWASGSAEPFTFRNYGQIRKTGDGVRTLSGSLTNLVHGQIAVESGQLEIDSPVFVNRGHIAIGSDQFMSPRAVFHVTGDYREGGHALLEIAGVADGDPDDLPRFGAGGTMSLAGDIKIVMSTTTPFTQSLSWQLGFAAARRIGQFENLLLTLPGTSSNLVYTNQRFLVTIEV